MTSPTGMRFSIWLYGVLITKWHLTPRWPRHASWTSAGWEPCFVSVKLQVPSHPHFWWSHLVPNLSVKNSIFTSYGALTKLVPDYWGTASQCTLAIALHQTRKHSSRCWKLPNASLAPSYLPSRRLITSTAWAGWETSSRMSLIHGLFTLLPSGWRDRSLFSPPY